MLRTTPSPARTAALTASLTASLGLMACSPASGVTEADSTASADTTTDPTTTDPATADPTTADPTTTGPTTADPTAVTDTVTDGVTPVPDSVPTDALMYAVAAGPLNPCGGDGPDFDIEWASFDFSTRHRYADPVNTPADEIWPRISPDRQRFIFYRTPVGFTGETCRYSREELWIANADGTGVRPIFSNAQRDAVATSLGWPLPKVLQGHADWSPDGVHVVMFLGRYTDWLAGLEIPLETQLFVLNVDSGELRQATDRRDPVSGDGISSDCSFSADGQQILFVGCPDAQVASCATGSILTIPADADKATTTTPLYDLKSSNDVYASPDGARIAWMEPLDWPIKVAPYRTSKVYSNDEITVIEPLGGFFGWTRDNRIIFNGGNTKLTMNDLEGGPSYQISPLDSPEVFSYPSP